MLKHELRSSRQKNNNSSFHSSQNSLGNNNGLTGSMGKLDLEKVQEAERKANLDAAQREVEFNRKMAEMQADFETNMLMQFQNEKGEVKQEFDRRFAVYKRKTEAELRRERQYFRELNARERQLNQILEQITLDRDQQETLRRQAENQTRRVTLTNEELLIKIESLE